MRQEIKNFSGRIIGYIEEDSSGIEKAVSFSGRIFGYYNARQNTTTDFSGRILAYGNILPLFFQDSFREEFSRIDHD